MRLAPLPLLALLALPLGPGAAPPEAAAQGLQEEARRQLRLAWEDLQAGQAERALSAAESAMRLDPLLYEALVVKALCHEALGELTKAEAILVTYLDFTEGLTQRPEAHEGLTRIRAARQAQAGGSSAFDAPFTWKTVTGDDEKDFNRRLTEEFEGEGFRVAYEVDCPAGNSEHQFDFEEMGFYFRVDVGGELKIRGREELNVELGDGWFLGKRAGWNRVELFFDGDRLKAIINDREYGPVLVRKERSLPESAWRLRLSGGTDLRDVRVAPWEAALSARPEPTSSAPTEGPAPDLAEGEGVVALRFERAVSRGDIEELSRQLGATVPRGDWLLSYRVGAWDKGDSEHAFVFPKERFYFKVDEDGALRVKTSWGKGGTQREKLGDGWRWGKKAEPNEVRVQLTGRRLFLWINGREFGPFEVLEDGAGTEEWSVELDDGELLDLVVRSPTEG